MLSPLSPVHAQRGNPRVEFEGQTVDAMIAGYMEEHRVPGMTLAIVQAPYISRVVGYGVADVDTKLLAAPKTLWNVGQMIQAYTAVAVMQLVEADKLTLDDTVGKHLADLPASWQGVTIRQLMGHVSGLPDYRTQPGYTPGRDDPPSALIALVKEMPLAFPPGTQVADCATDHLLLGLVVEKASGMAYEAFVVKNQIERLGLKNTAFASMLPAIQREAVEKTGNKHQAFLRERPYIDPTEVAGGTQVKDGKLASVARPGAARWFSNAALWVSAEDISLWDIGLAGSILVKNKENRDFLYHGIRLNDGTAVAAHGGWRFPGHKGLMIITGNVPGFSCFLSRFTDPSELLCVTLCANKEGLDLTELARRIAGAFDRRLGPPVGPKVMTCLESCHSVEKTVDRLEAFLKSKGIDVAARVDHAAAAKKKGLDLRPTQVLIFGNPAVGTQLMQSKASAALDLPLRVVVWKEEDGTVWAGYPDLADLARRHGIADRPEVIAAMRAGLAAAVARAVAPY